MIAIRVGQLAESLGVHRNSVTNWIKSGRLAAKPTVGKKYLIGVDDLRRFCRQEAIDETLIETLTATRQPVPPAAAFSLPSPNQDEVSMPTKPLGSVLVVGGGIAGMQATLDLANAGYAVHLIEKSAGIGGVMAQLDKTYPTNDCAM